MKCYQWRLRLAPVLGRTSLLGGVLATAILATASSAGASLVTFTPSGGK